MIFTNTANRRSSQLYRVRQKSLQVTLKVVYKLHQIASHKTIHLGTNRDWGGRVEINIRSLEKGVNV